MLESYQKNSKKRDRSSVSGTRFSSRSDSCGIPRPFPDFKPEEVRRAFDSVVGAKPFPSDAEIALLERARKFCAPLAHCPGVARVWVCNSLSMNAADADSDIDLFIEAIPGRIWTARVLSTLYFQLLGVRRHGNKVKGRFCLSFFATSGADFSKITIEDDVYLYEWVRRLVVVAGEEVSEHPFRLMLSQSSLSERQAMCTLEKSSKRRSDTSSPTYLENLLESFLKRLFLPRTLAEYERLGKPWGVRIDDEFLKFHPHDRRVELREEVRKRLSNS